MREKHNLQIRSISNFITGQILDFYISRYMTTYIYSVIKLALTTFTTFLLVLVKKSVVTMD